MIETGPNGESRLRIDIDVIENTAKKIGDILNGIIQNTESDDPRVHVAYLGQAFGIFLATQKLGSVPSIENYTSELMLQLQSSLLNGYFTAIERINIMKDSQDGKG